MATTEQIEQRVEEADTVRTARRAVAAKRVFELAIRRASVAAQLSELERELGDVLVESSDVIEIGELARFTDVPTADLTRWLNDRKTTRPKRKRTSADPSVTRSGPPHGAAMAKASSTGPPSTPPEPAVLQGVAAGEASTT